jgi:histidine triad (HIT) family protein
LNNCIFCAIVAGTGPAHVIYSDDDAIAFMDINPATDGHALVIPREHVKDLWEISEDGASRVMAATVRVAAQIRDALKPDGVNVMHATGAAAFQTVFHFHLHVIPRYYHDPIKLPWVPRPGDRTKIAEVASKIVAARDGT